MSAPAPSTELEADDPSDRAGKVAPFRVLDLFAGVGGLTRGFHSTGSPYRIVRAVEMDAAAARGYQANFGASSTPATFSVG
ncbi:DNA cytosine methyltransferase [Georgenia sp. SUBG003]|uniref:DNA cytosine methyltransferase n=1 Tax=Georgenia sp. SUBG003 TaxID=1497974 RepID=UPI003AB2A0A9